jgi:hypothetical protein
VVSPYVIEFTAFSAELATVLEGFYKSPNGLLVKALEVKPNDEMIAGFPGMQVPNPVAPINNPMTNRPPVRPSIPGIAPPPGSRPRPPSVGGAAPGAVGAGNENYKTVLDEKILKVTLWIDVLKPSAK